MLNMKIQDGLLFFCLEKAKKLVVNFNI